MTQLKINHGVLDRTLALLHQAGARGHEGIVLWLGERKSSQSIVTYVYEPIHVADKDYFHIPPQGMGALMEYLRAKEVSVLAQVHTHPAHAFHSAADDKWAIVRHVGALSLVLPFFARGITAVNFLANTATFTLTQSNEWVLVPAHEVGKYAEVTQ